ncbi:hypothetical protein [Granulicella paludicola]|uniref:hypothetical protein n=1 Tax=Granulicella paludicola TaxID=474951 RepID=UPI0021DFDB3B|nr:hypothetical protein [Granulicella paludicola]
MPTNDFDPGLKTFQGPATPENPGYELQDVNVGGIATFVAGLSGFVLIFYFFCFFMGKVINHELIRQDGPVDQWHTAANSLGATPHGEKREDLTSNYEFEQRQLGQVAKNFPMPQLQTDDGNQDTADLHAKEDLLLDNYSTANDIPAGAVRIPIDRAMELIVSRGLPKPSNAGAAAPLMAGETKPVITVPLTSGFARTGYELQTIQAREQKNEYEKAEAKQ